MANEETKKQLEGISTQLTQVNTTVASCNQLIEDGVIAIISGKKIEEGEKPLSITVSSVEIITQLMDPLKKELTSRQVQLLGAKEMILGKLEEELTGGSEKIDDKKESAPKEKVEKKAK